MGSGRTWLQLFWWLVAIPIAALLRLCMLQLTFTKEQKNFGYQDVRIGI